MERSKHVGRTVFMDVDVVTVYLADLPSSSSAGPTGTPSPVPREDVDVPLVLGVARGTQGVGGALGGVVHLAATRDG